MRRSVIRTDMGRPLRLKAAFITFMALTAACIGVPLFVLGQITPLTILNGLIFVFVLSIGIIRYDRPGWYAIVTGSAANALVFFISYCLVSKNYDVNYMYGLGFAVCMFTAGYFIRVQVQESYGLEKGPDRLEKEDFPHITKEDVV